MHPLHIVFVVQNFAPEPTGTGKYSGELALYLANSGHRVTVYTAPPYYPWWKIQEPYGRFSWKEEVAENLVIRRCPIYVPKQPRGIPRILHLASIGATSLSSLRNAFFDRPDLVVHVQPTLATAISAIGLSRAAGCPLWMHVQDLEVSAAQELGMIGPKLGKIAKLMEAWIYQHCDGLSTITESMRRKLQTSGAPMLPRIFPNWVDTNEIRPSESISPYRQELGIPDGKMVALYSGNMGEKQGLEIIIDAAAKCPDIQFILAGEGTARARLVESSQRLENVKFLPLQPSERMNSFLALGDIHLVPQKAGVGDLVMPSKMTSILAAGRPVVATATPGDELFNIAQIVGIGVAPGDLDGFCGAINRLAQEHEFRIQCGFRARAYCLENLGSQAILSKMGRYVSHLAKNGRRKVI